MKKILILFPLIWFATPVFSKVPIEMLQMYFQNLTVATAPFEQINHDGTRSAGIFYIKRPGRMRFEYTEGQESIVVAGDTRIAVIDPRSNVAPKVYPLNQTPLWMILKRNVDFSSRRFQVAYGGNDDLTILEIRDPKRPQYGKLRLIFQDSPLALTGWIAFDQSDRATQVKLGALDRDVTLDDALFDLLGKPSN